MTTRDPPPLPGSHVGTKSSPSARAPSPNMVTTPWWRQLIESVSTYLPVMLMGLLALGTWWLVKSTPMPAEENQAIPPRHVPDYTMQQFSVERYSAQGTLRSHLEGSKLRHYPDTDTIEVDQLRMHSVGDNSTLTHARAQRGVSNGDGSEVQLFGNARVERDATEAQEAVVFTSDFLHAFLNTEQVRSHLPMTLQRGANQIRGDSFVYNNLDRVAVVQGRVSATFAAPPSVAPATDRKAPPASRTDKLPRPPR